MRRTFIIDPATMVEDGITNLETVLKWHWDFGIHVGIVYRKSSLPLAMIADLGNLSGKFAVDGGWIEGFSEKGAKLKDIVVKSGDKLFREIRERVQLATEKQNLDEEIFYREQIADVIADLRDRMASSKRRKPPN